MTYVSVFLCFWRKIFKFIHGSDDCHWLCLKCLHFLPLLFLVLITCSMVTARTVRSCLLIITSWDRLVDYQPYYSNPTDSATPTTCCFLHFLQHWQHPIFRSTYIHFSIMMLRFHKWSFFLWGFAIKMFFAFFIYIMHAACSPIPFWFKHPHNSSTQGPSEL